MQVLLSGGLFNKADVDRAQFGQVTPSGSEPAQRHLILRFNHR